SQLAAGHQVEVITSVAPGELRSAVPVLGPSRITGQPGTIQYQATWRGRRTVLAGNYDLVHLHVSTFSPLSYLTAIATHRAGMPTVFTVHSLWSWATPIFRGFDLALDWKNWPMTWTAVSGIAAQSVANVLRSPTPVPVLPNGVQPELWRTDRR